MTGIGIPIPASMNPGAAPDEAEPASNISGGIG